MGNKVKGQSAVSLHPEKPTCACWGIKLSVWVSAQLGIALPCCPQDLHHQGVFE